MIGSLLLRFATLGPMTFVIVVVNYWIYRARSEFIDRHPAIAAQKPPTISRAISDPAIGQPFAFWISLSAAVMIVAFIPICRMYWQSGKRIAVAEPKSGSVLRVGAVVLFVAQIVTAVGMVTLSNYTFPDFHREHMIGSFTFFIGQSVSIALMASMCWHIAFDEGVRQALPLRHTLDPRISRIRAPLAACGVVAAVVYMLLFILKGLDLPYGAKAIYQAYVIFEPALISLFLAVFSTYYLDILRASRHGECGLAE